VTAALGTAIAGWRERLALRMTLGLAAGGQLLLLLALLGMLRSWAIIVLAVVAIAAAALRRAGRREWEWDRRWWWAVPALALLFVSALYPPLAFDETLYHLPILRSTALTGRIAFLPELRFPLFPQLLEVLSVPAYLALGDTATHLMALLEGLLLAALLLEWGSARQRDAGWLAAALVLGSPIVVHLSTTTMVDPALALFVAAGFRYLDLPEEGRVGRVAAAAGLLFGSACSVKHLGWYFAFCALLFLPLFGSRRRRTIPLFIGAFTLAVLPMYGRIVTRTGNPFFPYLSNLFGTTPWSLPMPESITPVERVVRMLRLPWDLAFARQRLNAQPPYTPLLAVALLLLLAAALKEKKAAFLVAMCAVYAAIFTFLPQDSRYLLSLLPLVALIAAVVAARRLAVRSPRGTMALVLAAMALTPGLAYAVYRIAVQGRPPVTAAERTLFLERRVPEYRALEHRGPGRIYVCGAEQLKWYAGDDLLGDAAGRYAASEILGRSADAAALSHRLSSLGVRYLLISPRGCPQDWQRLPRPPFFSRVYADGGADLWRLSERPAVH